MNYLRTGRSVAPTILPDLIALPIGQLTAAADEGLITLLEDLLAAEALTPFIRRRKHGPDITTTPSPILLRSRNCRSWNTAAPSRKRCRCNGAPYQ
ncbi:MAG: hypothetical protein M5U34_01185 [Chloroflexi bacterium]|nr:hypothetical protein [Chloroflexota bacterium]